MMVFLLTYFDVNHFHQWRHALFKLACLFSLRTANFNIILIGLTILTVIFLMFSYKSTFFKCLFIANIFEKLLLIFFPQKVMNQFV